MSEKKERPTNWGFHVTGMNIALGAFNLWMYTRNHSEFTLYVAGFMFIMSYFTLYFAARMKLMLDLIENMENAKSKDQDQDRDKPIF